MGECSSAEIYGIAGAWEGLSTTMMATCRQRGRGLAAARRCGFVLVGEPKSASVSIDFSSGRGCVGVDNRIIIHVQKEFEGRAEKTAPELC